MKIWKLLLFHPLEDKKKMPFYSNISRSISRDKGGKTSSWGRHENLHGGHHQHESQLHGGGWRNFQGRGSHGSRGGNHRG